ncbi:MAG: hypothetical protein JXQ75_01120 [Phycisphaerae bacterium]|nr:hypothetical protein [Phycisphaerae bacterium]
MARNCTGKRLVLSFLVGLMFTFAGCSGNRGNEDSTGSVDLAVMALSAEDAVAVTVAITGPGISPPITVALAKFNGGWGGHIKKIPAGLDRTFTLSATDSEGTELFHGEATGVTITPNQTVSVVITAQQVAPAIPKHNSAPIIDALVASAVTVAPGDVVSLVVTAHDPNPGDTLTHTWSADSGTLSAVDTAATTWTAGASDGDASVSVEVRDSHNAKAKMSIAISVVTGHGQGKATIAVALNTWPAIAEVVAAPARIDAGGTLVLDVVATDGDGDTLSYAWTSDCSGAFSSTTAKSPSFTMPGAAAGSSCTFTVQVDDGKGGSNVGSITIPTGPEPVLDLPPQVQSAYQSAEKVSAGDTVTMSVQAVDPNGTALVFAWSTTLGALGEPTTTGGTSTIMWTAPTPFAEGASIQVTITDATGQATVQAFDLQTAAPTWQWVSGPSLASSAAASQCWAAPGGEVFVVASRYGSTGQVPESWIYHLHSGIWSTALHFTDANLGTVFGTSTSDIYASVYRCPGGWGSCGAGEESMIWRFDGSSWSQMAIPNIGQNGIRSVRGQANDIYASYTAGILHYDGTSWSVASTTGSVDYGALAYLAPNEIYVLGCWGYHAWNGTTWTDYPGFDFCDVGGAFGLRAGDGALQLWAEGNNNFSNGIRAWQFVESPQGSMMGSWGSKYGTYINDYSGAYGTGSGIWAGGPNDFWVVGTYNNHAEGRIWHWDGTDWTRQLTAETITSPALGIWGTSPSDIWVVVADGRMLHYGN